MTAMTVRQFIIDELGKDGSLDTTSDHAREAIDRVVLRVENAISHDPQPSSAVDTNDDGELTYDTDYLDQALMVATLHFLSTAVLP